MSHTDRELSAARAAIAAAYLETLPGAVLGDIVLRDDQRRIVARAERAMGRVGGCLIAEAVGRGKTFIALALARRWVRPIVVAPAVLRSTWRNACERTATPFAFLSHESLSRGQKPGAPFDCIIVDESHHFRTMTTRRHAVLAALAARAPVVLLSATPLQNRVRDLAAQLCLFLGEQALLLEPRALSRFVIRSGEEENGAMPRVAAPEWLPVAASDEPVLRAILELSVPAMPIDGGDAGALRTIGLVRAWASSRAALRARLRSRARLAAAIEQGVEEGRAPTRREARAWHGADAGVQLGFPVLLMDATVSHPQIAQMRTALAAERSSMQRLLDSLRDTADPDPARIAALRHLRLVHPDSRVIAFSEYASTVASFFAALRSDARVGLLTARDARIASGRISRDELLARFAPLAQHARPAAPHESVTLLLATDLISEGVNLQDANIVVHLDLPWNPQRLAQRVGRARRPGAWQDVHTYLLAPPASAAALLDADARLRRKLAHAERVVGAGFSVLPSTAGPPPVADHSSSAATGELVARLGRWRGGADVTRSGVLAAAVCGQEPGWIAALDDGRLVAGLSDAVTDDIAVVGRVAELAEGPARAVLPGELDAALCALQRWQTREDVRAACGLDASRTGPLRQGVIRWLERVSSSSRRQDRAQTLSLVTRVRAGLRATLPLGTERLLAAHAMRGWPTRSARTSLEMAIEIVELSRAGSRVAGNVPHDARVVALIRVGGPAPVAQTRLV